MKNLGISPETVSPVLKNLLKLYNKNWELIEEDNYRTLADAIFEYADDYADDKVYSFTKYYFFQRSLHYLLSLITFLFLLFMISLQILSHYLSLEKAR